MRIFLPGLALAASLLLPLSAAAKGCAWNTAKDFYSCDNDGIWQSVGRSLSNQVEILGINPAALPAQLTPAGVQGVVSNHTDLGKSNRAQVSLIKGLQYLGFGLSTLDFSTFNRADLGAIVAKNKAYQQAYDTYRQDGSSVKGFQTGLSFMPPLGPISRLLHMQFGVNVAKSKDSNQYSPGYGIAADFQFISFGYSVGKQIVGASLPDVKSSVMNVGLQLTGLYAAYSRSVFHSPIGGLNQNMYSLRWSGPHLNFYVAAKTYYNEFNEAQLRFHATIDGKLSSNLSVGYMYGLYTYSHSVFAQLFF